MRVVVEFYNKDNDEIIAIENNSQDMIYLSNLDKKTCYPIMDIWVLDSLINQINFEETVNMETSFYNNLLEYIKEDEERYNFINTENIILF